MNHIHNVLKPAFVVPQVRGHFPNILGNMFKSFSECFRRWDLNYQSQVCYKIPSN